MNNELLDLNLFSSVSKHWKLQLWSRLSEGSAASLGKLRPKQRSSLAFRGARTRVCALVDLACVCAVLSDKDRPLEEPKGMESVIHTDICLAKGAEWAGSSQPPIWPLLESSSSPLSHHDMHVVLGWTIRPSETEEDQNCWRSGQHHVSNLVHDLPVELGQGFQSSPVKVPTHLPIVTRSMYSRAATQAAVCAGECRIRISSRPRLQQVLHVQCACMHINQELLRDSAPRHHLGSIQT